MKRFLICVIAMLLCLLPLGVLAEMETVMLNLTDPVISVNGTPVMDMKGLGLHIVDATSETGKEGFMQVNVSGGDETALQAILEIVDDELVLSVDGMSELYSLSREDSGFVATVPLPDGGYAEKNIGAEIETAVRALVEGELPGEIGALLDEYSDTLGELTAVGTENYTMLSGEMEMEHMTFEMSAEETAAFMDDLLTLVGEHPDFEAIKAIFDELAGYDVFEGMTLQELYRESGFGMSLVGDVYAKGESEALEIELTLTLEGEEEPGIVLWRVLQEPNADGGVNVYTDVDLVEYDEPFAGAYAAFTTAVDETGEICGVNADVGAGEYVGAEFVPTVQAQLIASDIMIGDVQAKQYTLTCAVGETVFTVNMSGYEKDGEAYGMLGLKSDMGAFSMEFEGAEGTDGSTYGVLTGSAELNGSIYTIEADVVVEHGTFDGDRVLRNADDAINVDAMSYDEMEDAEIELMAVLFNGVSVLDRNVPGLKGLMKLMIENFY